MFSCNCWIQPLFHLLIWSWPSFSMTPLYCFVSEVFHCLCSLNFILNYTIDFSSGLIFNPVLLIYSRLGLILALPHFVLSCSFCSVIISIFAKSISLWLSINSWILFWLHSNFDFSFILVQFYLISYNYYSILGFLAPISLYFTWFQQTFDPIQSCLAFAIVLVFDLISPPTLSYLTSSELYFILFWSFFNVNIW